MLRPAFTLAMNVTFALFLPSLSCLPQQLLLDDAGQHHKLLLLVGVREFLPVPLFLLHRPNRHLRTRDNRKERNAPTPAHVDDPNPRHHLKHIVWTRHILEADTVGNATLGGAGLAKVAKDKVRVEVPCFTHREERKADDSDERHGVRLGAPCPWCVGPICDVHTAKEPVVRRVLEDVPSWHSGIAKSMYERCLEFALDEVHKYQ